MSASGSSEVGDERPALRAPSPAQPVVPALRPPSFSVLIPTWNRVGTLPVAVASALDQVPPPAQVIVSDDGSDQDVAAALRTFGERVALVGGPRGGLSVARNRAAEVATGDYLVLLDDDDVYLPGRLAAIGGALQARPDLDVVTTDAWIVVDGEYQGRAYRTVNRWCDDEQRRGILERNFVFGQAAVRRSRFEEVGGFDASLRRAEDWDLWLRLVLTGSLVGLVDSPLGEYRRTAGSLTTARWDMMQDRQRLLARADHLLRPEERPLLDRTQSQLRLRSLPLAVDGARPEARRLALAIARDGLVSPKQRGLAAVVAASPRAVLAVRRVLGREHPGAR